MVTVSPTFAKEEFTELLEAIVTGARVGTVSLKSTALPSVTVVTVVAGFPAASVKSKI